MATITEIWSLTTDHRNIIRNANGTFSAARATATFSKTVEGTTTQNPNDGKLEFSFDGMTYTEGSSVAASDIHANGGVVEFRLSVRNRVVLTSTVRVVPARGGSLQVSYSNGRAVIAVPADMAKANDNILLTLYKGSGADRKTEASETVRLIPAGTPGPSNGSLDISPLVLFVPADSDGRCRSTFQKACAVKMLVNNTQATITDISFTKEGMSSAVISPSAIGQDGVSVCTLNITVNYGTAEAGYSGVVRISVTGKVGDKSYRAFGTITVEGNRKGESGGAGQGVVGPMCYITGEYSNALTYIREKDGSGNVISTPAVEVPVSGSNESEIWYLDADTNVISGKHISPKDQNQTVWKQGLSNYNLIRTKFLFADFANLGSFIVCGDWLISQAGEYWQNASTHYAVNGGTNHYTAFKSADPLGTGAAGYPCFAPNYAVNGLTGKPIMKGSYILGNVFSPLTRVTGSNYTKYGTVTNGELRIDLESLSRSIQIENIPAAYKTKIVLPEPTDGDLGCEMVILNVSGATLTFLASSHIYNGNANAGYVGALNLADNQFVKLKAMYIEELYVYVVIAGGSVARTGANLPDHLR